MQLLDYKLSQEDMVKLAKEASLTKKDIKVYCVLFEDQQWFMKKWVFGKRTIVVALSSEIQNIYSEKFNTRFTWADSGREFKLPNAVFKDYLHAYGYLKQLEAKAKKVA